MATSFDFEIEQLNFSLDHEISLRNNLEKENEEIEKNIFTTNGQHADASNDPNDCEWGRKYLAQTEINAELLNQIKSMEKKMNELEDIEPNDYAKNDKKLNDTDLRKFLRQLEKEKRVLEGNLKDTEWRLDSESQELFRLNEEKEKYRLDLNKTTLQSKMSNKQAIKKSVSPTGLKFSTTKSLNGVNIKTRQYGIPDNHRILDPRKGPVKKTAAVKTLPKISSNNNNNTIESNNNLTNINDSTPRSADSVPDKKIKKMKKSLESPKNMDERSGAVTT